MKMKRLLLTILAAVVTGQLLWGQSEVNKQINTIKRSNKYIYEESTMNNPAEAKEVAVQMLALQVNKFLKENGLPTEKKVTPADLTSVEYLQLQRGAMVCIFAYVKKSVYTGEEDAEETEVTTPPTVNVESPDTISTKAEPVDTVSCEPEAVVVKTEQPEQQPEPETQPKPEVKDEPETQPEVQPESKPETKTDTETVPEPVDEEPESESIDAPEIPAWQQSAIEELLKKQTLQEAVDYLKRLESRRTVRRFGTYNNCRNAAQCYWIVCDTDTDRTLLTILAPGDDRRYNYVTCDADALTNYSGMNAIWFEFIK